MTKTILLADDSVTIQKVIELTFMDQDWDVIAVSTGDEAVEKLEASQPDLVIADVHMPGANGYEVARRSKDRYPGVPVLLLVGTFEPFDEGEMASSGADSHLKKPFDSQELLQLVERLMESAEKASAPSPEPAMAEPAPGPTAVPEPPAAQAPESETSLSEVSVAEPQVPEAPAARDMEPATAEPSPDQVPPPSETTPESSAPPATGPETVRLESLQSTEASEAEVLATPTESESPELEGQESVIWGNLDLEAVEEEEAPRSTEVEAPADATPLSEQDAGLEVESEPFRLSEPEAEGLSLEPEPEAETPPPVPSEPAPSTLSEQPSPPEAPPSSTPRAIEEDRPREVGREPKAPAEQATAAAAATGLSDQDVERIARRVAELVGEKAVKDVAWEVIPDLAEVLIKDRIDELERQVESQPE